MGAWLPERLGGAAASPHGAARQPGCHCGALSARQRGRRSRSGSSVTGIDASPDGNAKGAGDGEAQAVEAMPPSMGSPLVKTGEEAGGWWNGGVLNQLSWVVVR
uniref:Uncharacterized protein n=1 Tax=Oryza sativa subsp. japonica TaxID=39947 RepID=Q6YXB9_ORYSJ|nr:hypothetical protein [Oryza sativa Japonica Group]